MWSHRLPTPTAHNDHDRALNLRGREFYKALARDRILARRWDRSSPATTYKQTPRSTCAMPEDRGPCGWHRPDLSGPRRSRGRRRTLRPRAGPCSADSRGSPSQRRSTTRTARPSTRWESSRAGSREQCVTDGWVAVATYVAAVGLGLFPGVLFGVLFTLALVLSALDKVGVSELALTARCRPADLRRERSAPPRRAARAAHQRSARQGPRAIDEPARRGGSGRRVRGAVVVVDVSAIGCLPLTVVDQFGDLHQELDGRGVRLVIAGSTPAVRDLAGRLAP